MKNCPIALNRKDFMVEFSGTFHYKWGDLALKGQLLHRHLGEEDFRSFEVLDLFPCCLWQMLIYWIHIWEWIDQICAIQLNILIKMASIAIYHCDQNDHLSHISLSVQNYHLRHISLSDQIYITHWSDKSLIDQIYHSLCDLNCHFTTIRIVH